MGAVHTPTRTRTRGLSNRRGFCVVIQNTSPSAWISITEPQMNSCLRVATWNMDHWKRTVSQRERSWLKLHELGVDVALLQETVPPAAMRRDHLVYRPLARARAWGSAVVALGDGIDVQEIDAVRTRYSTQLFSMLGSVPG